MNAKILLGSGCLLATLALALHPGQAKFPRLAGPYLGQKPPGTTPEIFAPGIVSTPDQNEFCASFSPDGTEFYFNRGMTVMVCRLGSDGWTAPAPASFNGGFRTHEAHLAFDNERLFFGGSRPPQGYGIWLAERTAGGWSEPRKMWEGMYATSARSGNIYFGVEFPAPGIVRTRSENGGYGEPVSQAVRYAVATPGERPVFHPGISPDDDYVVFDDNRQLYVAFREGADVWGSAVPLGALPGGETATIPSVSPDGRFLFFAAKNDVYWVSTEIIENLRPGKRGKIAFSTAGFRSVSNVTAHQQGMRKVHASLQEESR